MSLRNSGRGTLVSPRNLDLGTTLLINWTSPFPILGLFGGIFHFYSHFKRDFYKQKVETLIRWSGSALLPTSHKKDARLIWVNASSFETVLGQFYS